MKKTIILFIAIIFSFGSLQALALKTENWNEYNSSTSSHSFSIKFPNNWKITTIRKGEAGISPRTIKGPIFTVKEFEGNTPKEVISFYKSPSLGFLRSEDFVFNTPKEEFIAQKLYFLEGLSSKEKIMIRRGSTIIVMHWEPNYQIICETIKNSFVFTDNWKTYVDTEEDYTFILPSNFLTEKTEGGVTVKNIADKNIFQITRYKETEKEEIIKLIGKVEGEPISSEEINFFNIGEAVEQKYINKSGEKKRRIIFDKGEDTYLLEDTLFTVGSPEILESFDFFDIDIKKTEDKELINLQETVNRAEIAKMMISPVMILPRNIFKNCFLDVRTEWFAPYVCYAKARGAIKGYEDGNFKPSKTISRAEALKLIVGTARKEQIDNKEDLKDKTVEDISAEDWYYPYFVYTDNRNLLNKNHIKIKGEKYSYAPHEPITKQELVGLMDRIMK